MALPKKASVYHLSKKELTVAEGEVLFFFTKEFLTTKKIALRRGTTTRAVRYTFQKLRKKGYLDSKNMERKKKGYGIDLIGNKIRFHGLEFNIKLLFKDKRYRAIREGCNVLEVDGNTIRLFRDAIEVYINKSFYADKVEDARKKGFNYAYWLFSRLEQDLKVLLVKDRVQNVKLVKQHFAEVNNELAKDLNVKKEKLSIRGNDGKVWLLVDNSLNLHELETLHPELAEEDMNIIKPFFDDLRRNPAVKISDILKVIHESAVQTKETSAGLQSLMRLMFPDAFKKEEKKPDIENKPVRVDYIG